jgi:hypothetical protein
LKLGKALPISTKSAFTAIRPVYILFLYHIYSVKTSQTMKLKNTIIVSFIVVAAVSCSLEENNSHEKSLSKAETIAVKNDGIQEQDQACYDAKMEKWFKAFNDYQLQGLKMEEADKKATEDANREYKDCQSNTELANNTESAASEADDE